MQLYERLEQRLEIWTGLPHVAVCANGTAALHLALESLRLPTGCEVLVPDFAMYAVAAAVRMAGLTPVFVDCGRDLNINPDVIEDRDYGAILVVHTYGRTCRVAEIHKRFSDTPLVEDMAELHGIATYEFSTLVCWSFYRNKIVGGEEGGAVGSVRGGLIDAVRQLRNLGFTDDHDFTHVPRGINARLSNANAAMILDSLDEFVFNVGARRNLQTIYNYHCPPEWRMPSRQSPWVYDLRIPGLTADRQTQIVRALQASGIAARHAFKPLSQQEEFRGCLMIRGERHEAAIAAREVIYLPLTPGTTTEADAVRAFEIIKGCL